MLNFTQQAKYYAINILAFSLQINTKSIEDISQPGKKISGNLAAT